MQRPIKLCCLRIANSAPDRYKLFGDLRRRLRLRHSGRRDRDRDKPPCLFCRSQANLQRPLSISQHVFKICETEPYGYRALAPSALT